MAVRSLLLSLIYLEGGVTLFSRRKAKGGVAGLALHEDSLRYLELERSGSGLRVVRQEFIPVSSGGVVKESLQKVGTVEKAFDDLKSQLGKFAFPVVLGVPSRDVTLRLVEYPKMPLGDVRDALALEFDKYFPYAWAESASDIAEVDVPARDAAAKSTVLVATCRLSYMRDLLKASERVGIPLGAVEPMNVAFFRASMGPRPREDAYFIVGVEPEVTHIVLGYRDNGILFRSTLIDLTNPARRNSEEDLVPILKDVQNTMIFAGNQYRGIEIRNLVLGGSIGENPRLKSLLEAGASVNVTFSDVWTTWGVPSPLGNVPGYDAAFGLALRNLL